MQLHIHVRKRRFNSFFAKGRSGVCANYDGHKALSLDESTEP
jgi:hypothetical protein